MISGGLEGFGGLMGGGVMMLGMLLVWIVPIALVVAVGAVPSLRGTLRPSTQVETPLEILRRRFASGEISREEFEQAKGALV